jgi:hypothetical protein
MDERTITVRDSRSRRAPGGPENAAERPEGPGPYHGAQIGRRPRVYGDPGAFWHAQRSSRHAAEPTRETMPASVS